MSNIPSTRLHLRSELSSMLLHRVLHGETEKRGVRRRRRRRLAPMLSRSALLISLSLSLFLQSVKGIAGYV